MVCSQAMHKILDRIKTFEKHNEPTLANKMNFTLVILSFLKPLPLYYCFYTNLKKNT